MMKRTLYTFLAVAAISAPAMIAPAIFTPAAAQVGGYWRGEGSHRYWEHGRWQEERRFAEHRREERRGWNEHGHYYR